jgi:hypothetical protein
MIIHLDSIIAKHPNVFELHLARGISHWQ